MYCCLSAFARVLCRLTQKGEEKDRKKGKLCRTTETFRCQTFGAIRYVQIKRLRKHSEISHQPRQNIGYKQPTDILTKYLTEKCAIERARNCENQPNPINSTSTLEQIGQWTFMHLSFSFDLFYFSCVSCVCL